MSLVNGRKAPSIRVRRTSNHTAVWFQLDGPGPSAVGGGVPCPIAAASGPGTGGEEERGRGSRERGKHGEWGGPRPPALTAQISSAEPMKSVTVHFAPARNVASMSYWGAWEQGSRRGGGGEEERGVGCVTEATGADSIDFFG